MPATRTHHDWLKHNQGRVVLTRDLHDLGFSERQLRTLRSKGQLSIMRPGVARVRPDPAERGQASYAAKVEAWTIDPRRRASPAPLAGPAAAVWWDLPMLGAARLPIYVAGTWRGGNPAGASTLKCGAVPDTQVAIHRGVAVTSPARSVLDVARFCGLASGLVAADAALARGLVGADELGATADLMAGLAGAALARACARHADGRAESPGESLSRARMIEMFIPVPQLQYEVLLPDGHIARVDFCWHEKRACGEFDGLQKYAPSNAPGQTPSDVVIAEKRREDAIRALGFTMCRWVWSDLQHPQSFAAMLRTYLGIG